MKGVYLVNCAEGMNYTHMIEESKDLFMKSAISLGISLLKNDFIFLLVHNSIRKNTRKILKKQYHNTDRVDDELVDAIVKPSLERGARWAF